ncbi:hypothetical protein F4806DRAFT_457554 [Annulohypoxylon nitens]|nr:hypothetical protein F4806DRAFT_457554 [Annulohypoxylon nitens]
MVSKLGSLIFMIASSIIAILLTALERTEKHRTQDCSLEVVLHSVRELQWSWATAKEIPRTKYRVSRM